MNQGSKNKNNQLDFFHLLEKQDRNYSHRFVEFDLLPLFSARTGEVSFEDCSTFEKQLTFEDVPYRFSVKPSIIYEKDEKGNVVKHFRIPSLREEFVMDAVRKLITMGKAKAEAERLQAHVSLYEIRQELSEQGVFYNCVSIREALKICSDTTYVLEPERGKALHFRLIDTLALRTFDDWKEEGAKSDSIIIFGSLMGRYFFEGKYRRYNYQIGMHLKNIFARWLYKKMLTYYGASLLEKYEMWASTIIRESGIKPQVELRKTVTEIERAFGELADVGIIFGAEICDTRKEGRKIVDRKFCWKFMPSFISDLKAANVRMRQQVEAARKSPGRRQLGS